MERAACQSFPHLDADLGRLKSAVEGLGYNIDAIKGRNHLDEVYAYMIQQARCRHSSTAERLKTNIFTGLKVAFIVMVVLRAILHVYRTRFHRADVVVDRTVASLDGSVMIFVGLCLWWKFDVTRHFMSSVGLISPESVTPISRVSFTDLVFISLAGFIVALDGVFKLRKVVEKKEEEE